MLNTCTIHIKDEVNVHLKGLDSNTLQRIVESMSFYAPNYFFSPKYKLGQWDGQISLCKNSGYTYLHLSELWENVIKSCGYDIQVIDDRKEIDVNIAIPNENYLSQYLIKDNKIILRDYQLLAIEKAINNGSGILLMPTGSGKSLVCGVIAKLYAPYGKVILVVPTIDLALQTKAVFDDIGIDTGIWYGELKQHKDILVSTWQSLELTPELFYDVSCVIVDECQNASSKTLHKLLTGPGAKVPFRFGCTATLPKEDLPRYQIQSALGEIIYTLNSFDLQEKGILASSNINVIKLNDSDNPSYIKNLDTHDEWLHEVAWMSQDSIRMQYITDFINEIKNSGNTLILTQYASMGKALSEYINEPFFNKDIKPAIRSKRYKEIDTSDNQIVLASMGVASTGIDIQRLYNVILICVGKPQLKIPQAIGRGLRKSSGDENFEGKDSVTIWDITSNARFESKHSNERIQIYKKYKHKYQIIDVDYVEEQIK